MSKVDKLKAQLTELLHKNSTYNKGGSVVPKPDYQEIDARIKPVAQGRERGDKDIPPLGHQGPDDVELLIINTYQEMADDTAKRVSESLVTYNQRIMSFDITGFLADIRGTSRAAIADFQAEVTKGLNELRHSSEAVKSKYEDHTNFKEDNKLKRSATYPSSSKKALKYSLLVFLFLIETIANANFLSIGNEGGFLGAYSESIVIAALNVGTAVLLGLLATRYLFWRSTFVRLFVFVCVISVFAGAGFLNLAVAHYREISGLGLFGESGQLAIQKLLQAPFELAELQSWLLFFIGWLFWIIALVDAHTLDDNYPGYGRVARALKEARENYVHLKLDIVDDITQFREDAETDIKETRYQLLEVQSQVSMLFNLKKATTQDYEAFRAQVTRHFQQMLESYRNSNRSARSKSPSSFKLKHEVFVPELDDDGLALSMEKIADNVASADQELEKISALFYQKYSETLQEFKKLDELEVATEQKEPTVLEMTDG